MSTLDVPAWLHWILADSCFRNPGPVRYYSIMNRVTSPPKTIASADGSIAGGWWRATSEEDRIICDLCPRECNMKPGDRGFCFVRRNDGGEMKLTTYGRSTGFCIDPIEKKPLNHFYPGTPVLSFGTAGCNLGCRFCQNWDISRSREVERLSELAMPDMIAEAARRSSCRSVAYTYNDPIIWAEYAIDTAAACRQLDIKSVAVTAGYITPEARPDFFHAMDAANVDLKAFTEDFYHKVTYSHLQPVLDTLRWLKHESDVWFEITNLIIPQANDSPDELKQMCDWILEAVGADVPLHFSAFHPDFRMTDRGRTPHETLLQAKQIAQTVGVKFVYLGNVNDVQNQSTWCPNCGQILIERDWHELGKYNLKTDRCGKCNYRIPGHFEQQPGDWGRKRQPVKIGGYAESKSIQSQLIQLGNVSTQPQQKSTTMTSAVTTSPQFTEDQESAIHKAACEIVAATVYGRTPELSDPTIAGTASESVMGIFVTLKRGGQLRGCCGSVGRPMNLQMALGESSRRTVTDDQRFPRVSATELPHLSLDVTVLFNFEAVEQQGTDRAGAVEVGKHGVRLAMGPKSGLFLPVVAVEQEWDAETFLNQLCRKAGLPMTAWKDSASELTRFEGRMIERPIDKNVLVNDTPFAFSYTQQQIDALAHFAKSNVQALVQGAVPGCFPSGIADGTVDGIALKLAFSDSDQSAHFSQLQFRNGYPLQTTLLNLTQAAANWVKSNPTVQPLLNRAKADIVLFREPAMHGVVDEVDLSGIDPAQRAIMVREGQRASWCFARDLTVDEVFAKAVELACVGAPDAAQVFSAATMSNASEISNTNVPQPQTGQGIRKPAVAGRFYPSANGALDAIVKKCLGDVPEEKQSWPAVMVPHAGLQYSGSIAAGVLKQIEIPDTVIVIGPKHTPMGVDWAVAPHDGWQLPNGEMASDPELASLLAERIEGLQLDSAAHAQEHCIEVELPLLHALAPETKVVGITIGGGNLKRCITFGQQLALLISEMESRPLLIISSDMNHFATDDENRRLDELALAAMESLDPAALHDTVTTNSISMCGALPAVIVMETLLSLDLLDTIKRCGYSTSADVTGDESRVVGYAGMLLGE